MSAPDTPLKGGGADATGGVRVSVRGTPCRGGGADVFGGMCVSTCGAPLKGGGAVGNRMALLSCGGAGLVRGM